MDSTVSMVGRYSNRLNIVKPVEYELTSKARGAQCAMEDAYRSFEPNEAASREEIGRRLEVSRRALGLTAAQICRRIEVQPNKWSQWEHGKVRPSLDEAMRMRRTFGLTLDWIYEGDISGVSHDLAVKIEELQKLPPPPRSTRGRRSAKTA